MLDRAVREESEKSNEIIVHIYVCVIKQEGVSMFLPKTVVFKNKVGGSREGEGTPNRKLSLCNSDVKSI